MRDSRQSTLIGAEQKLPAALLQIQSLPFPYILVDPHHNIAAVNPAMENFLGQSFKILVGQPVAQILSFSDERLQKALDDKEAALMARSTRIEARNRPPCQIDVSISPIADNVGWRTILIREDIVPSHFGDTGAAGEPAFSMQSPNILAHEIKNPLAGIKGAAQLLERNATGADKALTELIRTEVERIAGMVDQMQSLGSKTSDPKEACNIYEILSHVRGVIEAANPGKLHIRENFDPSLPMVLGSKDNLSQIILNLLTNAVEACRNEQHSEIQLSTRYTSGVKYRPPGSNEYIKLPVELTISDNGPGVDERMIPHLFAPFVTSKMNGQGLGLALVQKLVSDMQGRVFYERDEAKGLSHFRLILACSPDQEKAA